MKKEISLDEIRLNKYLSDAGVCSRREADRLIEQGKVKVDGIKAVTGMKILPNQKVSVNGKQVLKEEKKVLIAVNKPVGIECTSDKSNKDNIIDYIGYPTRIYNIGRLDKNSHGLILMTNDGSIVNRISKSSNNHEKEYVVTVNKPVNREFVKKMSSGIKILNRVTKPCKVWITDNKEFHIILTEGMNRQIRRMCEAVGYRVMDLKRIRIMNINLGRLKEGTYRNVTPEELKELRRMLDDKNDE